VIYNLAPAEWLHAVLMWNKGINTQTISEYFDCKESLIYNKLPAYRKKHRQLGEIAA
jgi:hypothetical protein